MIGGVPKSCQLLQPCLEGTLNKRQNSSIDTFLNKKSADWKVSEFGTPPQSKSTAVPREAKFGSQLVGNCPLNGVRVLDNKIQLTAESLPMQQRWLPDWSNPEFPERKEKGTNLIK